MERPQPIEAFLLQISTAKQNDPVLQGCPSATSSRSTQTVIIKDLCRNAAFQQSSAERQQMIEKIRRPKRNDTLKLLQRHGSEKEDHLMLDTAGGGCPFISRMGSHCDCFVL